MAIQDRSLILLGTKDSYIDLGALSSFQLSPQQWTIEGWVRFTSQNTDSWVLGVVRDDRNTNSVWVQFFDGQLRLYSGKMNTNLTWHAQSDIPIALNTWYHIMLDFSRPKIVNGRNVQTVTYKGENGSGIYVQKNVQEWEQFLEAGSEVQSTLRETHRDDWSVYLRDQDDVHFQFDLHRKEIMQNRDPVSEITDRSPHAQEARLYINGQMVLENATAQSLDPNGHILIGGSKPTVFETEANGRNVKQVDYRGAQSGSFKNIANGKWAEYTAGSPRIHTTFVETGRDDWSVYLRKEDGANLQLDLHRKEAIFNGRVLYEIFESSVSSGTFVNGYNVRYVEYENEAKGSFEQVNKTRWEEYSFGSTTLLASYTETGRDEWSVYLKKDEDGTDYQLDLHRREVIISDNPISTIIKYGESPIAEMNLPCTEGMVLRDFKVWERSAEEAELWNPFKEEAIDDRFLKGRYAFGNGNSTNNYLEKSPIPPTPVVKNAAWESGETTSSYPLRAMEYHVTAPEFSGEKEEFIEFNPRGSFKLEEELTIEAWVKLPFEGLGKGPFLSHVDTERQEGWELYLTGEELVFKIFLGEEHPKIERFSFRHQFKRNVWYHITAGCDEKRVFLLVNGIQRSRQTIKGKKFFTIDAPFYIGSNQAFPDLGNFMGQIAAVRIWNVAVSPEAIQQLMYQSLSKVPAGLSGLRGNELNSSNLLGYWKLDATYSDKAIDDSSSRIHGTVGKVFRTLTHLPITNRKLMNEEERRLNVRKFWEKGSNTGQDQNTIRTLENKINKLRAIFRKSETEREKLNKIAQKLREEKQKLETALEGNVEGGSTLSSIIEKANEEIRIARKKLDQLGSDYKLGTVNLDLMVIPAGEGNKFILPEYEDQIPTGDQLSKLQLEFSPKDTGKKAPQEVSVPDVTDLTEVMAYRKLANAGLVADLKFQTTNDQRKHERVVRQIPEAGGLVKIKSPVIIFIGKES